jgi:uncharacterized protein (TIGR02246 family)
MQRLNATAEAAERAFYAAMADGDLDRMMALWADDDAAVCNHPGGPRLIGREAITGSFREIFSTGGIRIAVAAVHAWRSADVAVHSLIERITVEGRGSTETVEVVTTNVFVRSGGGWLILVHHAGVSESGEVEEVEEVEDDDDNNNEDEDETPGWVGARLGIERPDADEDDTTDADPRRPPPGRLH